MPVYEYECAKCGVFEVEQRIVEDPLEKCPTHPEQQVRRLISRSMFALKGGGWYSQGYGDSSGSSASSDSGGACASDGGGCAGGACAASDTD